MDLNIQNLFGLKGKTAFVSGASGALGGASARGLAQAGANLALSYNTHKDRLDKLLRELEPFGVEIRTYRVDVFDVDSIRRNADDVIRDFGRLDILVNIAGGNRPGAVYNEEGRTIFDLELPIQADVVTLNLLGGCMWPCLLYGKKMAANSEGGSIINISSINGIRPLAGRTAYAAAKAGVINYTQALAVHLAEAVNPKLRVNAIAPGFFPNLAPSQFLVKPDGTLGIRGKRAITAIPMGRMGEPDEMSGTVIWLASRASSYVTGITVAIDGGFLAYSPA
jgi:NAD(P)-dependent dehydrogenase (short-subunit alcohol dehydrogenase family)